jgi:hypothetical protein
MLAASEWQQVRQPGAVKGIVKILNKVKKFQFMNLGAELVLLALLLALCSLFYANFDPDEMRAYGIYPWDSLVYRDLAETFRNGHYWHLEHMYPFGPRILFPIIYGNMSRIMSLSYIDAAYYLNLLSAFLVVIFTFVLWRKYGVGKLISWVAICIFTISWIGPVRYSGFYPGGAFAFESLLVCILFAILAKSSRTGILPLIFLSSLVFVIACGREFVTYTTIIVLLSKYMVCDFLGGINAHALTENKFLHRVYSNLKSRSYVVLSIFSVSSICAYILSRSVVLDSGAYDYSLVDTILKFGKFHLDPVEFLYPVFYALGPFALCLLFVLSFKKTRILLFREIENLFPHADLVLIFCSIGMIFCMVGGTDSDRFLLWFFPFYALFSLKAVTILAGIKYRRMNFSLLFILVVGLMWSRFYVPAYPHLMFPDYFYSSYVGVRTNLDPVLYYGPSFMKDYRKPLKEIPINEAYTSTFVESFSAIPDRPPFVTSTLEKYSFGKLYTGSYKYDLNIIPVPFGYAHNQYELLSAHPFHGDYSIRIMLLVQWVLAYVFLILFNRRSMTS